MGAKTKPWTEAHRREARAFWLTWWAQRALEGADVDTLFIREEHVGSDAKFAGALYINGYPRERIKAAICRVRALAEGRLVRETLPRRWRVLVSNSKDAGPLLDLATAEMHASVWRKHHRGSKTKIVPVRVTRIRRAP